MENTTTDTFKKHYENLRDIAEKMRAQQDPDIDQLIPMVDSALGSYKVCKDRLESVKNLLHKRFNNDNNQFKDTGDLSM